MNDQTTREIDFSVFALHHLAQAWNKSAAETFRLLDSVDIIDGYLVPCYDVLHTLGTEYLVEDLADLASERGATL